MFFKILLKDPNTKVFWGKSNGDYSFCMLLVDELVQDIAEK